MSTNSKFPQSPHTYFTITNMSQARRNYLNSPKSNPVFTYSTDDSAFVERAIQEIKTADENADRLELVLEGIRLRQSTGSLDRYRSLNSSIYTVPDKQLAGQFMKYLLPTIDNPDDRAKIERVLQDFDDSGDLFRPSDKLFDNLKSGLERYMGLGHDYQSTKASVYEALQLALEASRLDESGWKISLSPDDRHARTIHKIRTIQVGEKYRPRSQVGAWRIAVHEVYGHALRGQGNSTSESEGFAGLLEQLLLRRYTSFRGYRYLAGALGWGVFGRPMNFNEAYEIIAILIGASGRYDSVSAKGHAFNECARVFRGADPMLPGAVFLKDTEYYPANMAVWGALEELQPSYEEFVDILEGRRLLI